MQKPLRDELPGAIRHDELELHFQPIVDLVDRRIVAYEALVRWRHPGRGLLLPEDFLALSEQSDDIFELGLVVMEQACRLLAQHPDADWQVFVNVSPRQLGHALPELLSRALASSGVPAARLGVEISESGVLNADATGLGEMFQVRELGVDIVVDDFTAGYSALGEVLATPVNGIKLARSITARLGVSSAADSVALVVAEQVASLSLHGVAEGIEKQEQAERALGQGWRYGQGYLFGRPAPADSVDPASLTSTRQPEPRHSASSPPPATLHCSSH